MTGTPALLGLFLLGTALFALTRGNIVHAALSFILTWFGLAGFYFWLGADFVAFAQIIVYVGAVSMVVLFAVLLTKSRRQEDVRMDSDSGRRASGGIAAAITVAGVLGYAVWKTPLAYSGSVKSAPVRELGIGMMGGQAAALLIVGVLLTVALLGAIVLAATDRK